MTTDVDPLFWSPGSVLVATAGNALATVLKFPDSEALVLDPRKEMWSCTGPILKEGDVITVLERFSPMVDDPKYFWCRVLLSRTGQVVLVPGDNWNCFWRRVSS